MSENRRKTIQQKTAKLEDLGQRLQRFVDIGGDLKSPEAAPLGLEFIKAFNDLSTEFGYEILKPIKKT